MSGVSDIILWQQIQKDDENSFSKIFYKYYETLYHIAGQYVSDVQMAENIVQDVFVNIWESRKTIKIKTNLKSYLCITTKNRCLNYIRQTNIKFVYIESSNNQLNNIQSPEVDYISNELIKSIHDAINLLPPKCREIFLLKRLSGLKYKEISEILAISENTVKTQIKRALKFVIDKITPSL